MLSRLLAKITGADKKKKYPDQQADIMGRVGDYIIIYPYGMYCNLPSDVLAEEIKPGMLVPITVVRPDDVAQGEPVIYHPVTNARITFRNNGDIDIQSNTIINVDSTTKVVVTSPDIELIGNAKLGGSGGQAIARIGDTVDVAGVPGTITSGSTKHTAT